VFAKQYLQPKLSRRRYAIVLYALQNNTVFRRVQNWVSVSDGSWTDKVIGSRPRSQKEKSVYVHPDRGCNLPSTETQSCYLFIY